MTAIRLEHDWYDAPLPPGVVLGERSWVYSSYAFLHCASELDPCVRVGDDAGVYDGTMFELGPQGSVEIGPFSSIVAAVVRLNGPMVLEDHALVSWDVFISDLVDDIGGPAGAVPSRRARDAPLVIASGAWVGAGAKLLRGSSVGRDAIVGAGAVVRDDVPAGCVVAGNPARVVGRR